MDFYVDGARLKTCWLILYYVECIQKFVLGVIHVELEKKIKNQIWIEVRVTIPAPAISMKVKKIIILLENLSTKRQWFFVINPSVCVYYVGPDVRHNQSVVTPAKICQNTEHAVILAGVTTDSQWRTSGTITAGRGLFCSLQNCCRMYCKTIKFCT